MKRNSIILPEEFLESAKKLYPEIDAANVEIRIDEQNFDSIFNFLIESDKKGKLIRKKKFARILREILLGNYDDDLYGKEEVSSKAKNVTAMKFTGSNNYRIGCKEFFNGNKKVVMITAFHKKSTNGSKNSKKEIAIYEAIGSYEYEF
ncbi:MAG: hypothetical protein KJ571_08520 [Bacteroidetes bacterium]|nr:hypothetical protein [Bacteroidota bacterium]